VEYVKYHYGAVDKTLEQEIPSKGDHQRVPEYWVEVIINDRMVNSNDSFNALPVSELRASALCNLNFNDGLINAVRFGYYST
jgi:hypothetical protein